MKIDNISFVIIARNEEFAIKKCLSSVKEMKLGDCEIICIDSGSTDNTLSIMKSFKPLFNNFKIFSIKGYSNSAIARNIGIQNSTKEYIYFVDGDIELYEDFIIEGIKKITDGFSAVTGDLEEYHYTNDYKIIVKKIRTREKIKKDMIAFISGGCFLAKRTAIIETGFFDERFERCEDIEFTSRFTKQNKMIAVPKTIGVHHTIPYHEKSRIKKHFLRSHPIYMGMVFRRNLINKNLTYVRGFLSSFFRLNSGTLLGFGLLSLYIVVLLFFPKPISGLIIFIGLFCDVLYGVLKKKKILYRVLLHYVDPLLFFVGLVFNIDPRSKYSVVEIKN